jgi:ubiquinone/menaquinone biosynthesis C-methylase UbiE
VNRVAIGRKFARLATNAVVARPRFWRFFRGLMRRQFETLAPHWDEIRSPGHLAAYERALDALPAAPARALDVGTGTGDGALAIARRFPEAEVVGVDLAGAMLVQARRKLDGDLAERVRFEVADASRLPYPDGSFDLFAHANMIPFFGEIARVLAPGGHVLFAFSAGAETPIYVPFDRLRAELVRRGFAEFAEFEAGQTTALLARKLASS